MLESYYVPDNPATRRAKEMYYNFSVQRHPDKSGMALEKEEVQCIVCTRKGNKKKYPKSIMKMIIRVSRRGDRTVRCKQYLCPACAKNYKPHSKSVGGKNY